MVHLAKRPSILISFSLFFCACASQDYPPEQYQFSTLITEQNLKLFELSYPLPQREFRPTAVANNHTRSSYSEKAEKSAIKYLEKHLQLTSYCRDGYFLLGRHAGLTAQRIRGECKEKATLADQTTFKNTIEKW